MYIIIFSSSCTSDERERDRQRKRQTEKGRERVHRTSDEREGERQSGDQVYLYTYMYGGTHCFFYIIVAAMINAIAPASNACSV